MGKRTILYKVGDFLGDCEITSIEIDSNHVKHASMICICGNEFKRNMSGFLRKQHKNCGCLSKTKSRTRKVYGVGINDSPEGDFIKGAHKSPFYIKWTQMLHRCYSETRMKTHPTYLNTVVSDDWLTFSNFKAWMETQDWEGMELDKDLLGDGDIYSAETCCFLPKEVNGFMRDNNAKGYFLKDKRRFSSSVKHPVTKKKVISGTFTTLNEATEGWRKTKRKIAEEVIEHFCLEQHLADALRKRYD